MSDREIIEEEPPKQKLLFEPSKFNPPPRVGGVLMLLTGALLLKYELVDLTVAAQHLDEISFQPLYSMLGGVLVALGLLVLVFGEHADALLGGKGRKKVPSKLLLWVLIVAPGLVAWGLDSMTVGARKTVITPDQRWSER